MITKEKDDELALFLELRRRDKDKNNNLLIHPQSDVASGVNDDIIRNNNMKSNFGGSSPISKIVLASTMPTRKTAAERFLDSENDKSDYDWLITPPGTPLFPSSEMESQKSMMSHLGMSNARATALTSRLTNILDEPGSKTNSMTKRMTVPSGINASTIGIRRPSSSGGQKSASRPATPTGRPTLPVSAKFSRSSTPTSRASLPSSKPSAAPAAVRSSTPTRATARSSTPTRATVRSLTPTRATARSSTPTARPSLPASRSASRPATPTRQPPTTSNAPTAIAPRDRSSSVTKSVPTTSKNPVASCGSSPTVKSRPWKPNEIPGFSLDAPPNLRTTLPERPASAARSRPGERSASTSRSRPAGATAAPSSAEAASTGRRRQQSCSPSRGRVSNGSASGNRISISSRKRESANGSDDVNPVLMGTKMVERVVNMRKLAPPKQDGSHFAHSNSYGKSSSLDSSGFGRSLSKKSLDMALRHMDIRRSISGNIRSLVTSVPASSMYSVRSGGSGSTKSRTISVPDSPLATCSNASSEPSVNNNSFFSDMIELENDLGSERGDSPPTSEHGR